MIDLISSLKLLPTLGIGASIGAAVSGGIYLLFLRRTDSIFYAVVMLGAMTGASIHGLLRYTFGPRVKRRRLETDVRLVKSLEKAGLINKDKTQEIIDNLVETSFCDKRLF